MGIIRTISVYVSQATTGFFVGLFFLASTLIGLYVYQHHWDELSGLPIVRELSDTYEEGWNALGSVSKEAIGRFYDMQTLAEGELDIRTGQSLGALLDERQKNGRSKAEQIIVRSSWNKDRILQKLKKAGFSKRKMRKAGEFVEYIDRYKGLALRDMYTSKVLASTKLAQALLESAAGNSYLAVKSNNQFGIKALPGRSARKKIVNKRFDELSNREFVFVAPAIGVFNQTDDHRYDRFEVYASVADSYKRHTQLLTRSCTMGRKGCYEWIWRTFPVGGYCDISEAAAICWPKSGIAAEAFFDGQTNVPYYAACAAGLKMAGYATSKKYHKKLTFIIATYELWRFDLDLLKAVGA